MSSQTNRGFEYLDVQAFTSNRTEIIVNVKNIGSRDVIIKSIFIQEKSLSSVCGGTSYPNTPIFLEPGASETITLSFLSPLASGITMITLQTNSGKEYPKTILIE